MECRRVYFARFSHETNTFARPAPTPLSAFFPDTAGTPTEGFLNVLASRGLPCRAGPLAAAYPSGRVADAAFETIVGRIEAELRDEAPLCVLLDLHGAMATESLDDAEGELLRRVRAVVGPACPVGVAYDLHGNVSQAMVTHCTLLESFKTYPHVDMRETGERVATKLLDRLTLPLYRALSAPPMLSHTLRSSTLDPASAMSEAVERGKTLERVDPDVVSVSIFAGFSLADVPATGVSVVVVARTQAKADAVARELGVFVWQRRAGFVYHPQPLEQSLDAAYAIAARDARPLLLLDHGDNVMSGSGARTATLLAALRARADTPAPFAVGPLCDPAAVEAALAAGESAEVALSVGEAPTVQLRGRVIGVNQSGEFVATGPIFNGASVCMGPSVAIAFDAASVVVLTSLPFEPFDVGVFTSLGVDPTAYRMLVLKSRMYARPVFCALAPAGLVECDTRGPTSSDYSLFHHEKLRRPIYPLEADAAWEEDEESRT